MMVLGNISLDFFCFYIMLYICNNKSFNGIYMQHNSTRIKKSQPDELKSILKKLGENIKIARKRRQWTMEEMGSRIFVSRQTLSRLERGDPGITLSVLVAALWVLGLDKELFKVADPTQDQVGIFYEHQNMPKRVRKPAINDKLDF